jgi:hypothetical protein
LTTRNLRRTPAFRRADRDPGEITAAGGATNHDRRDNGTTRSINDGHRAIGKIQDIRAGAVKTHRDLVGPAPTPIVVSTLPDARSTIATLLDD